MCNSCSCVEKILKLIRSIQGSLNCTMQNSAKNYGLNTTEFMVMFEIYNNEGISLNELSKLLQLPKSSVSRIVDQLVTKEIISRLIPAENRRMIKLFVNRGFLESKEVKNIHKELLQDIEPAKADRIISALEELKSIIK
ncbi:MAG: MarR family transcriptional regulator [Bacillota bacterium]|nr:MarR family transcriptional regulator [Bacillota bacterium]